MTSEPSRPNSMQNTNEEIVAEYMGLVRFWLGKMIPRNLRIDTDQLESKIVFELICQLGKTQQHDDSDEPDRTVAICRAITNNNVFNAVKHAKRLKRTNTNVERTYIAQESHCDSNRFLSPNCDLELTDFVFVLLASLDENHRRTVELKQLGRNNKQIAAELRVSVRTVQSWLKSMEAKVRSQLEWSERRHIPDSRLQTPDSRLQTPDSRLQTPANHKPFNYGKCILRF